MYHVDRKNKTEVYIIKELRCETRKRASKKLEEKVMFHLSDTEGLSRTSDSDIDNPFTRNLVVK